MILPRIMFFQSITIIGSLSRTSLALNTETSVRASDIFVFVMLSMDNLLCFDNTPDSSPLMLTFFPLSDNSDCAPESEESMDAESLAGNMPLISSSLQGKNGDTLRRMEQKQVHSWMSLRKQLRSRLGRTGVENKMGILGRWINMMILL